MSAGTNIVIAFSFAKLKCVISYSFRSAAIRAIFYCNQIFYVLGKRI